MQNNCNCCSSQNKKPTFVYGNRFVISLNVKTQNLHFDNLEAKFILEDFDLSESDNMFCYFTQSGVGNVKIPCNWKFSENDKSIIIIECEGDLPASKYGLLLKGHSHTYGNWRLSLKSNEFITIVNNSSDAEYDPELADEYLFFNGQIYAGNIDKYIDIQTFNEFVNDWNENHYNKQEIDEKLSDVTTKAELEEVLKNYYTTIETDQKLDTKQDKAELIEKLKDYVLHSELNDELKKFYTSEEIDEILNSYFTKNEITENYYNKSEVDQKIADIPTPEPYEPKASDIVIDITQAEYDALTEYEDVIYNIIDAPEIEVPTKVSQLENDANYVDTQALENEINNTKAWAEQTFSTSHKTYEYAMEIEYQGIYVEGDPDNSCDIRIYKNDESPLDYTTTRTLIDAENNKYLFVVKLYKGQFNEADWIYIKDYKSRTPQKVATLNVNYVDFPDNYVNISLLWKNDNAGSGYYDLSNTIFLYASICPPNNVNLQEPYTILFNTHQAEIGFDFKIRTLTEEGIYNILRCKWNSISSIPYAFEDENIIYFYDGLYVSDARIRELIDKLAGRNVKVEGLNLIDITKTVVTLQGEVNNTLTELKNINGTV